MNLRESYTRRHSDVLVPIAVNIENELKKLFGGIKQIDRISARAKDIERFLRKAEKKEPGNAKYIKPLLQIQDQIGARIVCYYKSDVEPVTERVLKYYARIEQSEHIPDDVAAFGYEGRHFILRIPNDVVPEGVDDDDRPIFFELQIKTLFQHAWSEAQHDISYKAEVDLTKDQERLIAYAAAQAWGADRIFDDLVMSLN